jgi:hypothetical protein
MESPENKIFCNQEESKCPLMMDRMVLRKKFYDLLAASQCRAEKLQSRKCSRTTIEQSIASKSTDSTGGVKLNEEVGPDYLK